MSMYERLSIDPALKRNWCGGMENSGLVISRTFGWSKSSRFCEARIIADSFLRTRLRQLRMYSIAVGLLSQIYSSSSVATVLPSVRSLSDI